MQIDTAYYAFNLTPFNDSIVTQVNCYYRQVINTTVGLA